MKISIFDEKNEQSGELELSSQVFGLVPRRDILARVVIWQLAKGRSGSHNVKGKSSVHGTTRKFVRQKGSGGARHGSKKAVQFRGGGVVFGPVNRDHGFDLQKKVRRLGLRMALSAKMKEGKLLVVDSLNYDEHVKTKSFLARFSNMKTALFVGSDKNENVINALSNIVGYDYVSQIGANVYDIIRKDNLVISVDAIRKLEERLI
ncbi:MAG: 50S ribosomal protein L4 [Holosporales bacterium]|jgi:large subunit ribosomal protein L4|nr:50S ribosomal protein L4 [Holosporales bacterium]